MFIQIDYKNTLPCFLTGEKSEENSPMFPALQSMTEDISKLELPNNPVLSTTESADDDIPEPPELTTRNLQV